MIGQLNIVITKQINSLLLYAGSLYYVVNFIHQCKIKKKCAKIWKSDEIFQPLLLTYNWQMKKSVNNFQSDKTGEIFLLETKACFLISSINIDMAINPPGLPFLRLLESQ